MSQDLRSFLEKLKLNHPEEILEINDPVPVSFQMTALAFELEKLKRPPALLFNNVIGFSSPVVSNLFASRRRIGLMVGVDESELVSQWAQLASKRLLPVLRQSAIVKEVIQSDKDVDLTTFPIPMHFEIDAGSYITAGIVIANDPDTGIGNLSYARMQVKSPDHLGVSLHSRGDLWDFQRRCELQHRPLEVAIAIGVHPAINLAAATRLPLGEDEMQLAGGLLGEPIEVVRAETVNVMVPANAEMVVEGVIEPDIRENEGPFGEYTGYATSRSTRNVLHVTAITHRRDMIFHDIIPGAASEHLNLSKVSRVPQFFSTLKKTLSNVVAMNYPDSGTHFHCYLSMRKMMDGQPRQAMALLFGLDHYLKLIIVVDEDIDVFDEKQVLWALATRFQADRDIICIPDAPGNLLDPSSHGGISAKLGLDATRKFGEDVQELRFSPEIKEAVQKLLNR
jgi:2,5-furandicarboxylate decarboxylase 1